MTRQDISTRSHSQHLNQRVSSVGEAEHYGHSVEAGRMEGECGLRKVGKDCGESIPMRVYADVSMQGRRPERFKFRKGEN